MRFMPPAGTPHREASLGLGGVGEPMRCAGCSLRRLLPPPHVGEHGSHVRHEQNPNHSPCQNVHNLTPYASARLSPWCDQRGWFLAHLSLHGIGTELASIRRRRRALRKKPHTSVDQRIEIRRLTWAEDERGGKQDGKKPAPHSEAAPPVLPLSAAAIW